MRKGLPASILLTIVALFLFSSFGFAQDLRENSSVGIKILDLIIVRPISAGVACASTIFYIGTSPLTYSIGVGEPSARILVEAPWRFTAARYLGDFDHYKDGKTVVTVSE